MRAFPGYWAFPGGGVSRSDKEATEFILNNSGAQDSAIVAVVREMSEELGVIPSGNTLQPVTPSLRAGILADKKAFLAAISSTDLVTDTSCLRHISSRTTPPFGPVQFENTFFHLHIGESDFNPSLELQTEFTSFEWMRPDDMTVSYTHLTLPTKA